MNNHQRKQLNDCITKLEAIRDIIDTIADEEDEKLGNLPDSL